MITRKGKTEEKNLVLFTYISNCNSQNAYMMECPVSVLHDCMILG